MRTRQLNVENSEFQSNLQPTSCRQRFPNAAGYRRVASKANSYFRTPVATERLKRLLVELRLFLVDRGHVATITDVYEAECDVADARTREIVLPVGIDALDDNVWPEAV